jgi:acyl carrier protein
MMEREDVLTTLGHMIREVVGDQWIYEIEIGMSTSFSEDLELESIEFVELAEKLHQTYGDRVDFAAWLAGMELDQIIALRVGQVVEYIQKCLTPTPTA